MVLSLRDEIKVKCVMETLLFQNSMLAMRVRVVKALQGEEEERLIVRKGSRIEEQGE